MNKLAIKFGTGVATAALIMTAFAGSAFASTTLTIQGNGVDSDNLIKVKEKCLTDIYQNSNTSVGFYVKASSNTGGNLIDDTTGADATNKTGDATTTVGLTVTGGSNSATLPDCCCDDGDLEETIKNNGVDSNNTIKSKKKNKTVVVQLSKTKVKAKVKARSNTGNNEITDTTGVNATVENDTGDAETTVTGTVTGGGNTL